ncbi:MAG: hypothetical protein L0H53_11160, partial [Candidatus Nitrosocosmicus sp.]|nr:hypothetical protein [Candidatus Nitrosocosmicus sp.]MDN5868706.1 hypothetical protein [Candidatus Nitrosocosmicus sp.]
DDGWKLRLTCSNYARSLVTSRPTTVSICATTRSSNMAFLNTISKRRSMYFISNLDLKTNVPITHRLIK